MLFNSLHYAVFLPIVFFIYWALPHKYRWGLILLSSYYFYMSWNPKYLLLIIFITAVSFAGAIFVERAKKQSHKKIYVFIVIMISLGLLFVFKYFNFVYDSFMLFMHGVSIDIPAITLNLLLPVGISFYTFQSIGYILDVYHQDVEAEHHFGKYAAFISFFPQLVAGPIERTSNLLPQLKKIQYFSYEEASYGLKLMAWGYFKKIVIADNLAIYVDKVYSNMHGVSGFARFAVIFFFSIQIYCDFSGYSDIARGTANLFSIKLMENFKSPYFASSIQEFWRRWHISLSTWFRDYIYIPLGGSRKGKSKGYFNLLITFLVSGMWHGASWNFIIWGGLHGVTQIFEKIFKTIKLKKDKNKDRKILKVIFNFIVISVLWVFFRAQTLKDAAYMLVFWFRNFKPEDPLYWITNGMEDLGINNFMLIKLLLMLLILMAFDYISLRKDVIKTMSGWKTPYRWAIYICFVTLIFLWAPSSSAEFIYFDF